VAGSVAIAKLSRPRSHSALPRERLFALLDDFRTHPIRWIAAPPGAGKTTLAASWLEARALCSCWYRIDERDADPATLFYYLGEAARELAGEAKRRLPLFGPEYAQGLPAFAHHFFESFFAHLPRPFIIVIDDYHEIPVDSQTHAALLHGLTELPLEAAVLVLSRQDPPADYVRLSVSGALQRIDPAAMRLDDAEVAGMLHLQGVDDRERIRAITEHSQGWAAGIQLLLATDPGSTDAGPKETLFDYFASEIFRRLPEAERRVLLCAALLPACTVSLARQLSGETGAGEVLNRLYRRNYFVTRDADVADPLYRFHPLFQEFLLAQVREAMPQEQQASLRLNAAGHLEQEGNVEGAIALRLAARDAEGAAVIIASAAEGLLRHGRHRTVTGWIEALPLDTIEGNPWLLYWKAMARLPFAPGDVLPWLKETFESFRGRNDVEGVFASWAAAVESIRLDLGGDATRLDPWISVLDELLASHPEIEDEELSLRLASNALRAIVLRNPQHPRLDYWKARTIELARRGDSLGERTVALYSLAVVANFSGRLDEASSLLREAPPPDTPGLSPMAATYAYIATAMEQLFRGHFDRTLDVVDQYLATSRASGVTWLVDMMSGRGVSAAIGKGDLQDAARRLDHMAATIDVSQGWSASFYGNLRAQLAYRSGDYEEALQFAQEAIAPARKSGWSWPEVQGLINSALPAMEHGNLQLAAADLDRAQQMLRNGHALLFDFTLRLAAVRLAVLKGEDQEAAKLLRDALAIGRRRGDVEIGHLRPEILADLWGRALSLGIEPDYVRQQIRLRQLKPPPGYTGDWPWPVRITALGNFTVELDEAPLRFTGKTPRKPLELLQAIIAFGGRGVASETIKSALWPDAEGDAADTSLRVTLLRLRKLLRHEGAVTFAEGRLGLDDTLCSVDVDILDSLLTQIENIGHGPLVVGDEAGHLATRLTDLYHGAFLVNEREFHWMLPLRQRLRGRFIAAAEALGSWLEQAGAQDRAIVLYRHALDQDNLAEPIYRRLMFVYLSLGEKAEALAVYGRCKEMLSMLLGVSPSAKTQAAAEAAHQTNN